MTNKLLLCLLILFTLPAHAQADKHQHHGRVGSHGMVLITDGEHLYASHLPLYRRPHDYQLIYQVSTKQSPQLMAQLQQGMVTLLPENFDLNQLIEGQNFTVKSRFFTGHFERGGQRLLDTPITFERQVYRRRLSELPDQSKQTTAMEKLQLPNGSTLLVNQIGPAPSFDAIGLKKGNESCQNPQVTRQAQPMTQTQLDQQLAQCGQVQWLYLETRDFAK